MILDGFAGAASFDAQRCPNFEGRLSTGVNGEIKIGEKDHRFASGKIPDLHSFPGGFVELRILTLLYLCIG